MRPDLFERCVLSTGSGDYRGRRATPIVALTILLASCGGGDPVEDSASRASSAQPAALVRTDAGTLALGTPSGNETSNESAFHGCMRRLNVALRSNAARKDIDAACLTGTFVGRTRQGEACALRIAANTGRESLFRAGNAIELELPLLRASARERSALRVPLDVMWADVEVGHLGMQFRSGGGGNASAVESVVVTSGPRESDKLATLDDLTYERTEAGKVQIVRCQFSS